MVRHKLPLCIFGWPAHPARQLGFCRAHEARNVIGATSVVGSVQKREVRHDRKAKKPGVTFRLFRTLEGAIEPIEEESQTYSSREAHEKAQHQTFLFFWIAGPERRLGAAHDIRVGSTNLRSYANFFQTLEHAVIELAGRVHFTSENRVLHGRIFKIES